MKCSIFKRTVCFFLIVTFLFGISTPVFAADEDSHAESIGLNAFFENGYDTMLLDHNTTGHMTFVEDMRGKVVGTLAMEVLAKIYGEEPEPNEAKYMEVLINIMMTYEMENAADISEQCKMDTLKATEDYAMDAVKVGTGLLFAFTKTDTAAEPLMDWIETAVGCLETVAGNTENWIDGIGDLNALLQNYSKHDAFLYQIESLATGELQSAASKLRTSMTSAMKVKLETYSDISEDNFPNYSEFFFKDVFFEALKLTEEYAADEGFHFFVDLGSDVMDVIGVVDVIELGVEIGKFVGNVAVNGEDIINRVLEMKVLYDISIVLENWLKEVKTRVSAPYSDETDNLAINYVRSANYLISCRIRGEYCMYSLLAKNSGLYSHFGEETAKQAENVYNRLTLHLAEIKEQLDGVLNVLVVNMGSERPYEAVNANSKWNVYGRNGQLYDNYTLRIYDKQNLLNFVHAGSMDDPDPTVTEYVADSTEPLVITLEEGYAYTFEFVDNADAEKVKLMTVGVTDNDSLQTSVVEVETEFGTMRRKLTQINVYDADGNLQVERKKYYNENGMLTGEVNNNSEFSTYVYDSQGRLIEYHQKGSMYDNYFTYNEKGQKIKADLCYGMAYYEYDSVGRLCKTREEWDTGTDVTVYVYDTEGKLIGAEITCTEENGPKSDEWVDTVTYTYDSENRLIQELCEGEYVKTSNRYDYTFVNLVIDEYLINDERSGVFVHYYDVGGNDTCGLSLSNPRFYADAEGYLAKVVDTYTSYGKIETTIYEFYYDDVLAVPLDNPSDTSIIYEEVVAHTYEEAEKLLYEYLGNDYGFEGLEVRQVPETGQFEMTISGEGGAPIYIINWYTVNLDTGEVRNAETYRVVCDLW